MHKSATKCNETSGKWCKNKHGASKIIDMLETYQCLGRPGTEGRAAAQYFGVDIKILHGSPSKH
jgi:hypothetical protein